MPGWPVLTIRMVPVARISARASEGADMSLTLLRGGWEGAQRRLLVILPVGMRQLLQGVILGET